MLNSTEIKSIVNAGEGFNAEFKERLPTNLKGITEEVCAFANASGGVVLIGVDDKNVIKGVSIENSKRSAIQNSIGEISPPLQCEFYIVDVEGKDIAVIEVPSGQNKPYVLSGAIYVRQGPNSQKLTTVEEMRNFFQQAEKIYFDEAFCKEIDIKKDIPAKTSRYEEAKGCTKGGYLVKEIQNPDITLIANGSEVSTLLDAAVILEKEHNLKINIASIISEGLFKSQPKSYQESIIPKGKLVFGLTAGLPVNLEGLIGDSGKIIGLDHFGYSAPANVLDEKFGFTSQHVASEILKYIQSSN